MEKTTDETKETIEFEEELEGEELESEKVVAEIVKEVEKEKSAEELLEEATKEAYLERLQRTMAEFDNYRKRTDKEKAAIYDLGLSDTVLAILPVLDNFERALIAPCEDKGYVKGMEMIYKQMIDLLKSIGVTQIETIGKKFDTNLHNAAMHVEDEDYGPSEIIEEFQKGYMYKDEKVIRYSMVKVAN